MTSMAVSPSSSVIKTEKASDRDGADPVLYDESYHPPFLIALILLPPILPLFWNYHVQVTTSTVSFGYSTSWTSIVVPNRMKSVQVVAHVDGLRQWGGWGIRYSLSRGEWGYIPKNGPGLRITFQTDEDDGSSSPTLKSYTFLCDQPEKVAKLLVHDSNTQLIQEVEEATKEEIQDDVGGGISP